MQKKKDQLMTEFEDVFKKDLDKNDRIRMKPVEIETIPTSNRIRPHNAYTPIETPIHLQKAANKEIGY